MANPFTKAFWGLGKKAAVNEPFSIVSLPSMLGALLNPQEITPAIAWLYYLNVSPFAKVVDLIADAVSALEIIVEEDGQPVDGHPVANFLSMPGFNRDLRQFMKELTVQHLVTGTAYTHVVGPPDVPPLALDVLKTKFCNPTPGADMWPDFYLYSEGTRSIRFRRDMTNPRDWQWLDMATQLGEIVPMYDHDGNMRGVGLPRLNAIKNDVEMRLKGIIHNSAMLDKGARLSGVLAIKEGANEQQERAVQAMFDAQATGAANAGKVLVTSGGALEFTALSQNMKDMDFAKLISIVEDSIASRYNVPVTLFRTDAQTNNNYETAWNVLYDQAVLPTFKIVTGKLSRVFSRRLRANIQIKHDALTSPILARQAVARAVELHRDNLISRNEARGMVGFEPVLGGDIIYGPLGQVPQGEDLFTGIDGGKLVDAGKPPGGTPSLALPKPKDPADDEQEESRDDNEDNRKKSYGTLTDFAAMLERW